MELLKLDCKFEKVKITDDYPPGIYPMITYGIHRTLMDAVILISSFNSNSIIKTIGDIAHESKNWRVDFPMKGGLIATDDCPHGSPYYTFVDWIQKIGHSIENERSSGPTLGWDKKNGIKLTPYEIRFLKDISTDEKEYPKHCSLWHGSHYRSYEGFSKHIAIQYLVYISLNCRFNPYDNWDAPQVYMSERDRKEYHRYLWRCNTFLNNSPWLVDLYNICRKKFEYNVFVLGMYDYVDRSHTFTHIEKRLIRKLLDKNNVVMHRRVHGGHPLQNTKLDIVNVSKSRLNFSKTDDLCPDIIESVVNYYDKVVLSY